MEHSPGHRVTWTFVAVFLLAGVLHTLEELTYPFPGTLLFIANFALLTGLILFWALSLRVRLLPSRVRTELLFCAGFMLLFLLLRAFRLRVAPFDSPASLYTWYGYYIPIAFMPTLFLMSCVSFLRLSKPSFRREHVLLIPPLALSLLVLTNNLHRLAFRPIPGSPVPFSLPGAYTRGPVFYLICLWSGLCLAGGIAALFFFSARRGKILPVLARAMRLLGFLLLLFLLLTFAPSLGFPPPYHQPEIIIFAMMAAIEICIRTRLMVYNENYAGFFSAMPLPVLITDRNLNPFFRSAGHLEASRELLSQSILQTIQLDPDTRMTGVPIPAGYSFSLQSEAVPNAINRRLKSANELLAQENDLIQEENKLSAQKAALESRNRIHSDIFAALYPTQQKIAALLASTSPEAENFPQVMARCCVLNTYVKRRSNLMLLSGSGSAPDTWELLLALQESLRYLSFCGLNGAASASRGVQFTFAQMLDLYDAFEELAESLLFSTCCCTVSIVPSGLRLVLPNQGPLTLPPTDRDITLQENDGYYYLSVPVRKEAAL